MKKFLTLLALSLFVVSCIDQDYDLSDLETDNVAIGGENSVFTCPLLTLSVSVSDITGDQGDLDRMLAEANVWLPNQLPGGSDAVDVAILTGDDVQARETYLTGSDGLLTNLMKEIDNDPTDVKLTQIARLIFANYSDRFMPEYLPSDVPESEYIAAFKLIYKEPMTHDKIWDNIKLFAREYLTGKLNMSVQSFELSGIDIGSDIQDMITGTDGKSTISLFGEVTTDLPLSFSAAPAFMYEANPSQPENPENPEPSQPTQPEFTPLISFPAFTVSPKDTKPAVLVETKIGSEQMKVIFERATRIDLDVRLEKYFPKRSLETSQGIEVKLKVRKKGGLSFNI